MMFADTQGRGVQPDEIVSTAAEEVKQASNDCEHPEPPEQAGLDAGASQTNSSEDDTLDLYPFELLMLDAFKDAAECEDTDLGMLLLSWTNCLPEICISTWIDLSACVSGQMRVPACNNQKVLQIWQGGFTELLKLDGAPADTQIKRRVKLFKGCLAASKSYITLPGQHELASATDT